ncbi:MAG: hypothetical protein AB1508_19185 [Pseudomonadota bacterium]
MYERPRLVRFRRWNSRELALLGTASDRTVARWLARSVRAVENARRARGIPGASGRGYGGVTWTPERDALLGLAPDRAVADELGTSHASVGRRRRKLGIPAFGRIQDRTGPDGDEVPP